jgi:predicted glycoside hydrolase/deacetylase ChbG (UPF0249 family)
MKRLIVNADDFGYSPGVTRGILEAHERGIVTSTSLMVDEPAAEEAVELARDAPRLGLGLHAVLGDGNEPAVPPDACEAELERQLARFETLVGRRPTHLDSHYHHHRDPRYASTFAAFARRHSLPMRDVDARHCGLFYGRWDGESHLEQIGVESLLAILGGLEDGDTELGCHPGYADRPESEYAQEREHELATLTDPRVRARVDELELRLIRWDELR